MLVSGHHIFIELNKAIKKWFIYRENKYYFSGVEYLWKDGRWREQACSGETTSEGYYSSEEEASKELQKLERKHQIMFPKKIVS